MENFTTSCVSVRASSDRIRETLCEDWFHFIRLWFIPQRWLHVHRHSYHDVSLLLLLLTMTAATTATAPSIITLILFSTRTVFPLPFDPCSLCRHRRLSLCCVLKMPNLNH